MNSIFVTVPLTVTGFVHVEFSASGITKHGTAHTLSHSFVKVKISKTYALRDAAQAHRDLEDRKTFGSVVGSVVLKP